MSVPELPAKQSGDGPMFRAPWEAHAFALAVRLSEAGCFTWSEWAAALSGAIQAAQARGDADLGATYYEHWLEALEKLCSHKNIVGAGEMASRKEAWRRAYLHTPHGQPVELAAAQLASGAA